MVRRRLREVEGGDGCRLNIVDRNYVVRSRGSGGSGAGGGG